MTCPFAYYSFLKHRKIIIFNEDHFFVFVYLVINDFYIWVKIFVYLMVEKINFLILKTFYIHIFVIITICLNASSSYI